MMAAARRAARLPADDRLPRHRPGPGPSGSIQPGGRGPSMNVKA